MANNIHIIYAANPIRGQLVDSRFFNDRYPAYRNAELIVEVSRLINDKYCRIYNTSAIQCAKELTKVKLERTSLDKICLSEYYNKTACIGKNLMYRSADGSCNNLKRSSLGKSTTAYKRLLPPVYLDGVNTVRTKGLPIPRDISIAPSTNLRFTDPLKTIAMAYWTVFIGHDLSHTAMSNMRKSKKVVNCCFERNATKLPSSLSHKLCMPIEIRNTDPFYRNFIKYNSNYKHCMNYVRSVPAMRPDCTFGPREQMNQATHYLDGSMIYGSSEQQMWSLRAKSKGQLLTHSTCKNQSDPKYMPLDYDPEACQFGSGTCYMAGDPRASGLPQLTVLHTLWMREHNRLAKQLSHINPHWGDERIFQEARKIVTASIQHITYAEWLPALLGENYTRQNGLELLTKGYSDAYNDSIDPSVSNSFATAILPFSNSMISDKINLFSENRLKNGDLDLNNHYNQPIDVMRRFFDQLVRGLSTQNTFEIHVGISPQLTNYLFKHRPRKQYDNEGFDVFSLDIQRSRDHGLPTYTQFRKYCGLKAIENEEDWSGIIKPINATDKLKYYRTWNDIDLFIGALFEKHEDGSMVGPTMSCIIKEQFIRTRIADRYFYDLPKVFNEYQLAEIRKVTLARVFCDNSDNITTMQKQVFFKPSTYDLQLCNSNSIPKINLNHWFENVDTT
ncbi:peroxidase-like isoform X2 [Myzus persicae]|nr:peroxidase-like isoform X2 [Myzus persicae]